MQKEGPSILRCKGILAFKGDDERFVFQGVHMILDGDHQRPWKDGEKRDSRIVFIGRNLPGKTIAKVSKAASPDRPACLTPVTRPFPSLSAPIRSLQVAR